MKKIYNEYFRVTEHEKIRDKVMLVRVVIMVAIVIACLAGMTFTAYAYFSQNVTSTSNKIKSANFTVDTTISIEENGTDKPLDNIEKIDSITYSADLKAGKTYKVTLAYGVNSTATTGFCVITADNCSKEYHSQQLGADELQENGKTPSITFNLTVSKNTKVTFTARWGTSVYYADYAENYAEYAEKGDQIELYITNNETVNLNIDVVDSDNADTNTDKQNVTTTNTTTNKTTTFKQEASGTLNSIVNGTSNSKEASQTTTTSSTATDNNNPDANLTSDATTTQAE